MHCHIETPDYVVIEATDLGMVKAASSVYRACNWRHEEFHYYHADNPERYAVIQAIVKQPFHLLFNS